MKRMLLAAIAAATALVPAAAIAQERGEHRGNGGWMRPEGLRGDGQRWGGGAPRAPDSGGSWQRPQTAPQAQDRGDWRRPDSVPRSAFQQPQGTPTPAQPPRDWRGGDRPDWRNRGGGRRDPAVQDRRWDNQPRPDWNRDRNWNANRNWNSDRDWGRRDGDRRWNDRRDWDRAERWRGDRGVWNNGWRSDHRYDWRAYRDYNRSLYRLPRYYPPARWSYGYRRFSIGYRIDSFLFAPQYWISDPYSYRLPDVWGPYRWVRYYDDALLVDVDTGQVVDVIYGIFW
ncbi:RcnB family protein [Sphingomonas elodea]|uniref:RcnB family protein n=1 Tax=Sphingomonas elodea TaxID=179878 RepID=UPI00026313D5|nr:RcnB family protein [Sphingomonas elodea]